MKHSSFVSESFKRSERYRCDYIYITNCSYETLNGRYCNVGPFGDRDFFQSEKNGEWFLYYSDSCWKIRQTQNMVDFCMAYVKSTALNPCFSRRSWLVWDRQTKSYVRDSLNVTEVNMGISKSLPCMPSASKPALPAAPKPRPTIPKRFRRSTSVQKHNRLNDVRWRNKMKSLTGRFKPLKRSLRIHETHQPDVSYTVSEFVKTVQSQGSTSSTRRCTSTTRRRTSSYVHKRFLPKMPTRPPPSADKQHPQSDRKLSKYPRLSSTSFLLHSIPPPPPQPVAPPQPNRPAVAPPRVPTKVTSTKSNKPTISHETEDTPITRPAAFSRSVVPPPPPPHSTQSGRSMSSRETEDVPITRPPAFSRSVAPPRTKDKCSGSVSKGSKAQKRAIKLPSKRTFRTKGRHRRNNAYGALSSFPRPSSSIFYKTEDSLRNLNVSAETNTSSSSSTKSSIHFSEYIMAVDEELGYPPKPDYDPPTEPAVKQIDPFSNHPMSNSMHALQKSRIPGAA